MQVNKEKRGRGGRERWEGERQRGREIRKKGKEKKKWKIVRKGGNEVK